MFNQYPIQRYREDFPILQEKIQKRNLVYLDNASTTQKPWSVIQAVNQFYQHSNANVHRSSYILAEKASLLHEQARDRVAQFLKTQQEQVIFTYGTTHSINMLVYSLGLTWGTGVHIILSQAEHHSNLIPWQIGAKLFQWKLHFLSCDDYGQWAIAQLEQLLKQYPIRLCALTGVSNVTGFTIDVSKVVQLAHQQGALVFLDLAQWVAHKPFFVNEYDIDFLAFSSHKIYGPSGVGILWGRKKYLETLIPPFGGGKMLTQASMYQFKPEAIPYCFEAGTPALEAIVGFSAALEYVNSIGIENIFLWEKGLHEIFMQQMQTIDQDYQMYTFPGASVVSICFKNHHPHDLALLLDTYGICVRAGKHCAYPYLDALKQTGTLRVSWGLYNSPEEIYFFVDSLKKILKRLTK